MPNSSRRSRSRETYESLDEVADDMVSIPFADVARCVAERENETIGPTLAHVVFFSPMLNQTQPQYWRRFLYPICTTQARDGGPRCGKSLEFGPKCGHDSFAVGKFTHVYRFEVFLIDAIYNGETTPMRCTISEAASVLLGVAATEFGQWTDDEQEDYVTAVIKKSPLCHFYFVLKDGDVTAHIMTVFEPVLTLKRTNSCFARISVLRNKGKEIVVDSDPDTDDSPLHNLRGFPDFSRIPSSRMFYSSPANKFVHVGSSSNPRPGQGNVTGSSSNSTGGQGNVTGSSSNSTSGQRTRNAEEARTADQRVAPNARPRWIRRIARTGAALTRFGAGFGHATPRQGTRIAEEAQTADQMVAPNARPRWIQRIVRTGAALKRFGGGFGHATPRQGIVASNSRPRLIRRIFDALLNRFRRG